MSRLEQVVEEINEEEKVKEVKRENKRQKKRARRKEKCKYGELPSSENSQGGCNVCKESLPNGEIKHGDDCKGEICDEDVDCKVETCSDNVDLKAETCDGSGVCQVAACDEGNLQELSSSHEHCECSESQTCNGEELLNGFKMQNGQTSDPESGCSFESECGKSVEMKTSCKSDPMMGCNKPSSDRVDLDDYKNSNKSVCFQSDLLNGDLHHDTDDTHDSLPVDDEEKQLLLSMGWHCAESCQVSAGDV